MALSNKFGHMLMTTGNKSEMSVGYATIYGDMAGGYNPLKDAYKMTVFAISEWRNKNIGHALGLVLMVRSFLSRSSPSRQVLNCVPTRRTAIHCRPIRCSTRCCTRWSRKNCRSTKSSHAVSTGLMSCGSSACSTSPSIKGGKPPRASSWVPAISGEIGVIRSPTPSEAGEAHYR